MAIFNSFFCLLYVYQRVPQLGHCFPAASHKNPRLVPREVPSAATGQSRSPFQGAPFGSRKMFMVSLSVENNTFIFMLYKYFKPRSQKIFQGLHHFHVSHGSIWSIWKLLQLKDVLIARCMVCNFIESFVLIFSGTLSTQFHLDLSAQMEAIVGSPFPVRLWNKLWGFEG